MTTIAIAVSKPRIPARGLKRPGRADGAVCAGVSGIKATNPRSGTETFLPTGTIHAASDVLSIKATNPRSGTETPKTTAHP